MEQYKNFMAQFEKGHLVGVDIGLSAIKVAQLSKSKKTYKLDKYVSIPLSEAAIIEDEVQKPEEIIAAIKRAFSKAKIKTKIVNIGMDGPNTMTKRLQVPDGSKDEVEDNIIWESEQYIPFGAEDSEIDYYIIDDIQELEVKDVIVGALRSDTAEKYVKYAESSGLFPRVVDLNVFAISNIFEHVLEDDLGIYKEEGVILIDFGAQTTTVIVYKNGGPLLTKEINVGGVLITEEIQRVMGVSYEEAEDLKIFNNDTENLPEEILQIIYKQIESQISEIKKVLNFYIAAGSSEQITNCLVMGGGSKLPGLLDQLDTLIGGSVEVFNLFDRIEYDQKNFSERDIEQIARMGIVSIGLGMRSV